jgi:hypothetical protein
MKKLTNEEMCLIFIFFIGVLSGFLLFIVITEILN